MNRSSLQTNVFTVSVVLIIIALIFGIGAWNLILSAQPRSYGQGYIPFMAALGLGLCGLVLMVEALKSGKAKSSEGLQWRHIFRGPVLSVLLLVAYAVFMNLLGFALTTFLLMFVFFRIFRVYSWPLSLIVAGVTAISFHYVFLVWLFLPLPLGVFFS